mgnify:CR=1 FL=1
MSLFRFKQFSILQAENAMKVGTDAMLLGTIANYNSPKNILDIGAGTGVLSLMMAQKYPSATIHAVELDEIAAKECLTNFKQAPWANRLRVDQNNFISFKASEKFDVLISNPPYYQTRLENQDARKSRARHESSLPVELMLNKCLDFMHEQSLLWVIIPSEIKGDWIEKANANELHCIEEVEIHGKKNAPSKRNILAFCRTKMSLKLSSFTVRDESGNYTKEYIDLTFDFHFNDLRKIID